MKIVAAAVQCKIGGFESAEKVMARAVEAGAEIVLFPEYFSYSKLDLAITDQTLEFLRRVSREMSAAVCGNAVVAGDDGLHNRAFVFDDGELIGWQDKIHPTRTERVLGIRCGTSFTVLDVRGIKVGILVCADILYPELCRVAALKGSQIVLNPVVSFKRSELPGTEYRYCLYFTRAFDNCYGIVKAGGFGKTFTGSDAVGRSLIATFDGVLARSSDEYSEEAVVAEMDLQRVEECRRVNYSLSDRNVRVYADLLRDEYGSEC